MTLFIGWLVIGVAVGWAIGSFMSGRGGTKTGWNVLAGLVGGLAGGYSSFFFSRPLFGEGPEFLVSFVGAAIGAVILVLLARLISK